MRQLLLFVALIGFSFVGFSQDSTTVEYDSIYSEQLVAKELLRLNSNNNFSSNTSL
ncbi:MAG: hypothetical protein ACJASQ_002629 [Crocinitomicaceae bacterium]|jgi:hypothetical protein